MCDDDEYTRLEKWFDEKYDACMRVFEQSLIVSGAYSDTIRKLQSALEEHVARADRFFFSGYVKDVVISSDVSSFTRSVRQSLILELMRRGHMDHMRSAGVDKASQIEDTQFDVFMKHDGLPTLALRRDF